MMISWQNKELTIDFKVLLRPICWVRGHDIVDVAGVGTAPPPLCIRCGKWFPSDERGKWEVVKFDDNE